MRTFFSCAFVSYVLSFITNQFVDNIVTEITVLVYVQTVYGQIFMLLFYHILFFMFLWAYWQTIFTPIRTVPSKVREKKIFMLYDEWIALRWNVRSDKITVFVVFGLTNTLHLVNWLTHNMLLSSTVMNELIVHTYTRSGARSNIICMKHLLKDGWLSMLLLVLHTFMMMSNFHHFTSKLYLQFLQFHIPPSEVDRLSRADSQETQKQILETFAKDLPISNRLRVD